MRLALPRLLRVLATILAGVAIPAFAAATAPPKPPPPKPQDYNKPKQEDPKVPTPSFPAAPPYKPPTPVVINPPSPAPKNPTPAPPPMTIYVPKVVYSTHVAAPTNFKFGRAKAASGVQSYLSNLSDSRDLEVTVNNYLAQQRASHAAAESYAQLFERQKRLYASGALSKDELNQSRFDAESAEANEKVYAALAKMYEARRDERLYLMKVAANAVAFKLDDFYAIFARDWEGQCESESAMLLASEAQLRLNRALFDTVHGASQAGAASWTELEQRKRDLAAAEADVDAKAASAAHCRQTTPTLESLKTIFGADPKDG